jgi:hypothetical protein
MAELFEHFTKEQVEAVGRILGPGPPCRVEQFVGTRLQLQQVLQVPASVTVDGGMELQENLVAPADIADREARSVISESEPLLQSFRQSAMEESLFRDAIIEPVRRQIELSRDGVRGFE